MTLLSLLFAGLVVVAFALLWLAIGRRSSRAGWLARLGWLTRGHRGRTDRRCAGPDGRPPHDRACRLRPVELPGRPARAVARRAPAPQRRVGQPPCRLAAAHGTHRWRRRGRGGRPPGCTWNRARAAAVARNLVALGCRRGGAPGRGTEPERHRDVRLSVRDRLDRCAPRLHLRVVAAGPQLVPRGR